MWRGRVHRENFPFFQTAPDGWKNTIRHNLCFNSSFRKTCNQMCRDGKRKSCFWHLTSDGQQRLMDEISTLPGETFKQLERSMSHPGEELLRPQWRQQKSYSTIIYLPLEGAVGINVVKYSSNDFPPRFRGDKDSALILISEDPSRGFSCTSR